MMSEPAFPRMNASTAQGRHSKALLRATATLILAGTMAPAAAFAQAPQPLSNSPVNDAPLAQGEEIGFAADSISYDDDNQTVTASGNVQLLRDGNRLNADEVVWNRSSGKVVATGHVRITDAEGNIGYGDRIDITDSLKDGMVDNMLLVMERGGRLAATHGSRANDVYTLDRAAYTPCAVEDSNNCPKTPSWQIKAVKVYYRPGRNRVSYRNARLELFGVPIAVLPAFSHPASQIGGTGLLVPDVGLDGNNGLEISTPFFWRIAANRDMTITPRFFTDSNPLLDTTYRAFTDRGAYRITGIGTYGRREDISSGATKEDFRGYIDASGKFQLTPQWSVSGSLRRTTDRTFLRRYNISREDRLRSTVTAERISTNSYFSLAGWAVQGLRQDDVSGQMPIALPAIDYRLRLANPILGGRLALQANSLAILRTRGQDTQRAFVGAVWNLRRLTKMGQEITLTGYARGDVYHASQTALTPMSNASYRGLEGWQSRGIATAAVDMRWPFSGPAFGGTQRITPRIQLVASPKIENMDIPNEDARSVELEDSNLFALNRFPGYDRVEDSTRVTYGVEYALSLRDFTLNSIVGQSYRLNERATIPPDGTGLSGRTSDFVGRTTLRYRNFLSLSHRYRLDKDNLAIRRNELDLTLGSKRTYVTLGYLRLNRNITSTVEDLSDREELRVGARVQVTRFVSVFGSTVIDMTDASEIASSPPPITIPNGFEPVRHRLGISYQDDCLELDLTWKREYQEIGDARKTNAFQLRLAFRNLGI